MDAFRDSMSVVRQRKVWDNVLKMVSAGEMPPKEEPRPTVAEIEQFVRAGPRDAGIGQIFERCKDCNKVVGQVTNLREL